MGFDMGGSFTEKQQTEEFEGESYSGYSGESEMKGVSTMPWLRPFHEQVHKEWLGLDIRSRIENNSGSLQDN